MITSKGKSAIEDHFDTDSSLDFLLKERNQLDLISSLEKIARQAQFCYIRQPEPLGLGHAIWLARHVIGKEHFGIFLPDDIIISKVPAMLQLLKVARQEKASVIAVQEVPISKFHRTALSVSKNNSPQIFSKFLIWWKNLIKKIALQIWRWCAAETFSPIKYLHHSIILRRINGAKYN